jgi:hypothetical protein
MGKCGGPRGDNGFPNLNCNYDETFMGGAFNINGYRYENGATTFTSFVVGSDSITNIDTYKLNVRKNRIGRYSDYTTQCGYEWADTTLNHNAFLSITKLDKQKRIVSGTFEFAQIKQGCGEVRITQGRFDMKY